MAVDPRLTALRTKVAELADRIVASQGRWMRCAPGCSECCEVDFGVFPVEAEAVEASARALPEPIALEVARRLRAGLHCVFLVEHRCAVYDERPIICRAQGLPLQLDDGSRTACPLNFAQEGALEQLPAAQVLNLELLNRVLAGIQAATAGERGLPDDRVRLATVAHRVLSGRFPLDAEGQSD